MERFKSSEELMGYIQTALEAPFTGFPLWLFSTFTESVFKGFQAIPNLNRKMKILLKLSLYRAGVWN